MIEKSKCLRTLVAKLRDQEIKSRKKNSDEESFKVIQTLVKQRKESANIYSKAGRLELADKEKFEISILNKFLPESMSEKDIIKLVKEIIKETNAKKLSDIGKVMPLVMQKEENRWEEGKHYTKVPIRIDAFFFESLAFFYYYLGYSGYKKVYRRIWQNVVFDFCSISFNVKKHIFLII